MWRASVLTGLALVLLTLGGITPAQAARFDCTITSVSPATPNAGEVVTFEGTASGDLPPYNFTWDFGDGNSSVDTDVT